MKIECALIIFSKNDIISHMIETLPLEYTRWNVNTVSPEELGVALLDDPTRTKIHSHTTPDGRQHWNILEIDGRPEDTDGVREGINVIVASPWGSRISPIPAHKGAVVAQQRGARVWISDTPSQAIRYDAPFNDKGHQLTREQLAGVRVGNFGPLAHTVLEGIDSYAHFEEGEEIQVIGESMAANTIVYMVNDIAEGKFKPLNVTRMELIEPVNVYGDKTPLGIYQIAKALGGKSIEALRRGLYIRENNEIGYPNAVLYESIDDETAKINKYIHSIRRQRLAAFALGSGLRKGFHTVLDRVLSTKTENSPLTPDSKIILSRAADSTVTFRTHYEQLADHMKKFDVPIQLIEFIDSIENYSEQTRDEIENGTKKLTRIGHSFADSIGRWATYISKT
jgi:hypothetical protein